MGAMPDDGARDDFSAAIGAIAQTFMNATVRVQTPNSATPDAPYDATADTGGSTTPTVIRSGPARIQKIRRPLNVNAPNEWSSAHQIRVQMALDPSVPFVPKGSQVVVVDGGNDKTLEALTYIVTMSVNSSWAALTTYECIAEIA